MISYNPLWKQLIDKGIKHKTDLKKMADISGPTLAKLNKNEKVSLDIIEKLCINLDCKIEEVIEIKK